MKGRLPPGLSARQFQAAVARLREAVGSDWVFTGQQDIATYLDGYTPFRGDEAEEYVPSGAVAPSSVEQVQRIVRIANEYKLPLWPVSCGRNLGYGGSAPRLSGTLVLDLKRMNRILEVDEHRAYALVEPGVSYFDFYRHLQQHQLKLWVDSADPGWGSLIGNAMDHGVGQNAHRDHFASICGMEVVLPNGELMRTGSGSIPGSKTWNAFPYGFGPHVAPLFGQGNLGIVTKAGFYLQPEPEVYRSYGISVSRFEDIHPFLDTLASLIADFTVNAVCSVNSPLLTSPDPAVTAALAGSDGEPSAELDRLGRERGLGYWSTSVNLSGAPEVVEAKWEHIQQRMSAIPGVRFAPGDRFRFPQDYGAVNLPKQVSVGIPNMSMFAILASPRFSSVEPSQNHGHLAFSPVIAMSGEEYLRARKVLKQAHKDLGMGPHRESGGIAWFRCSLLLPHVFTITDDAERNAKIRRDLKQLVRIAADNGWGEYRTTLMGMDDAMAAQSFNDHALLRFHETLKDALDPNGILAPGRSGIWPKQLRGRRLPRGGDRLTGM